MRDIPVTRLEFDEFLWPIVTNSQAESDKERSTAVDVLRLLSDDDYTDEIPLTDAQIEQAIKSASHVWNSRRLSEDQHVFTLEEEEYRLINKRLTDAVSRVSIITLGEFSLLLDKFRDAEKYKVPPPDEATEQGESEATEGAG